MLVEASSYTFSRVLLGTQISHTCTAGAVGQFASGIGNTDAGFVLGNGKILPNTKLASVYPFQPVAHWANARAVHVWNI